jgi:MYXO-CTERM domain-containing protein
VNARGGNSSEVPADDSGCSCRAAGAGDRSPSKPLTLLGVLGTLAFVTRRRKTQS